MECWNIGVSKIPSSAPPLEGLILKEIFSLIDFHFKKNFTESSRRSGINYTNISPKPIIPWPRPDSPGLSSKASVKERVPRGALKHFYRTLRGVGPNGRTPKRRLYLGNGGQGGPSFYYFNWGEAPCIMK